MAVISVRLNTEEEKIIDYLADYYEEDKSSLIRHSLKEMYEDIIDRIAINDFEKIEKKKKPKFLKAEEILKGI